MKRRIPIMVSVCWMLFLVFFVGCSEPNADVHPEPRQPPENQGAEREEPAGVKLINLPKGKERATYFHSYTWYYGSDDNHHYIIGATSNNIYVVNKSEMPDQAFLALYREKISRKRSVHLSGIQPMPRSAEFLAWLDNTKVYRIPGIEKKEDMADREFD
jgi:hypothetical protein